MRIGVLTSSRADFGIYLPLIQALDSDKAFNVSLIVFGTHLSKKHGYTVTEIFETGFSNIHKLCPLEFEDSPSEIGKSIGHITSYFASYWKNHKEMYDLVFCLGDRFEMFAAVLAGVPFGIKYAHLHGGETTLGAIDNVFRHSITLYSTIHFTSTEEYSRKVENLIGNSNNIFAVGSLSLDNLLKTKLLSKEDFFYRWKIDLTEPTILVTYHPETVSFMDVGKHTEMLVPLLIELSNQYQILITMPNADTNGTVIRNAINDNFLTNEKVYVFENLGKIGYFSAMNLCCFMLGNTSSGIIEAASFNKYVINIGKRQKGRLINENVLHADYDQKDILDKVKEIVNKNYFYNGTNLYYKPDVANSIINILKTNEIF